MLNPLTKGLAGAVVLMGIALFWAGNHIQKLNREMGKADAAVSRAGEVNDHNAVQIEGLTATLEKCIKGRKTDDEANEQINAQLAKEFEQLERDRQRLKVARKEIFKDSACKELAAINIAVACPALASSLRDSSNSLDRVPDG